MARDNVTFKFRIDLTQMTIKGREAIKILEEIERKSGKASMGVSKLGAASAKSGQQTAAAAINFQTATQGMLNLSTAAVQTYTSISNLDRANNRAKMSVIAVARAEDLLANKIERQNALREAGQAGSQKYINITKEIATAQADLTVKQEKMGIEQAAVNDIYMLFATNVANVTISSMQTIAVLDKNSIILNKAKAAAIKLQSLALRNGTTVQVASNVATKQAIFAQTGYSFASIKATIATHGLSVALKGLTRSFAPLMIATAALTAVWAIHESDILGTKTALDEYLGVEEDHLKIMEEERRATDALTAANNNLSDSYVKLRPEVKQTYEMLRDAAIHMGDARLAAQYSAQLLGKRPQDFSSPSAGGGFSGTSGGVSVGQQTAATTATGAQRAGRGNAGSILPQAYAEEPTVVKPSPPVDNTLADPFGTVLQQELYKGLNPIEQRDTNIVLAAREQNAGRPGASKAYLEKARQLLNAAKNYVEPTSNSALGMWEQMQEGVNAEDTSFFGMTKPKKKGFGGKGSIMDFSLDNREMIKQSLGIDVGAIANVANVTDAIKLARLQAEGKSMRGRGGRAEYALAAVGGNATQAYQIQEFDHLRTERRRELDIKDANTNRLRWGGRLLDGMTVWDEGAVVGGYGSAKAFSEAGKRKFYASVDEARTMLQFFGGGIDSSRIIGRSSRRSEYNRVLRQGTSIKEALTLAGLGYRKIETHLGRRPSRGRMARFQKEMNEIISFNSNQYAKANVINLLQQDYELTGFTGSTMSLPSLQDRVAAEDERMRSIGLNRTEAFQIIDTEGRGREEIDDRILWKDRVNNMSTGTSVL